MVARILAARQFEKARIARAGSLARSGSEYPCGVLAEHAVVVQDGQILDVLPAEAAQARYAAAQTLALPGQASGTAEWKVSVPAEGQATLTYRVRVRY